MSQMYPQLRFPQYVYQPYPKWVNRPGDDVPMLVNTKEEHEALLGSPVDDGSAKAVVPAGEPYHEKAELIALKDKAAKLGIKVHHKSGVEKIRQQIAEAEQAQG